MRTPTHEPYLPTLIKIPTYVYLPTYTNLCQPTIITYLPLSIPKYQYIIAADPLACMRLALLSSPSGKLILLVWHLLATGIILIGVHDWSTQLCFGYFVLKNLFENFQTDPDTNRTTVKSTPMRLNPLYVSLYVFWSKFIFIEIIPYVTIMVNREEELH